MSPFSVAAVLSMAHVGAKSNTALEMASALHLTEFEVDQISKAMGKLCHELKVKHLLYKLNATTRSTH